MKAKTGQNDGNPGISGAIPGGESLAAGHGDRIAVGSANITASVEGTEDVADIGSKAKAGSKAKIVGGHTNGPGVAKTQSACLKDARQIVSASQQAQAWRSQLYNIYVAILMVGIYGPTAASGARAYSEVLGPAGQGSFSELGIIAAVLTAVFMLIAANIGPVFVQPPLRQFFLSGAFSPKRIMMVRYLSVALIMNLFFTALWLCYVYARDLTPNRGNWLIQASIGSAIGTFLFLVWVSAQVRTSWSIVVGLIFGGGCLGLSWLFAAASSANIGAHQGGNRANNIGTIFAGIGIGLSSNFGAPELLFVLIIEVLVLVASAIILIPRLDFLTQVRRQNNLTAGALRLATGQEWRSPARPPWPRWRQAGDVLWALPWVGKLSPLPQVIVRDLVALCRAPLWAARAIAAPILAALILLVWTQGSFFRIGVAIFLIYFAGAASAKGFGQASAAKDQSCLMPGGYATVLAAHLVVPIILSWGIFEAAIWTLPGLLGTKIHLQVPWELAVFLVPIVLLALAWRLSASTPPEAITQMGAVGDFALVGALLWQMRGPICAILGTVGLMSLQSEHYLQIFAAVLAAFIAALVVSTAKNLRRH